MLHFKTPLLFFFILLVLPFSVRAQTVNQTDSEGKKQGKWVKTYPDGKPEYEGNFKDDEPVGVFKYYDIKGNLVAKVDFNDDGSAKAEMYYEKGEIAGKGNYSAPQVKTGLWTYYDQHGNIRSEIHYKNNKKHGSAVYYYKDGSVIKETAFVNGLENGLRKEFFANGNPKFWGNVVDGNFDGEIKIYYPNGKLMQHGTYANAVKDGTWTHYDEKGRKTKIVEYKNGNIVDEKKQLDSK